MCDLASMVASGALSGEEEGDDGGAHEVGHGAGEHGAEAELGEVVAA